MSTTETMQEILTGLITDIQNTGGLIEFSDGQHAPKADPTWTDLGSRVLKAHAALEKAGIELRLNIEEVDYTSDEAEDYI